MRKILLIHPKNETDEVVYPLPGIYLSSFLIREGFSPIIYDQNEEYDYEKFINDEVEGVICVGITAITGSQVKYGIKIAAYIKKKAPKVPIVWGGRHVTAVPDITIRNKNIDYLIRGEGEEPFLELVKTLEKKGDPFHIAGLSFKKDNKIIHNKDAAFLDLTKVPYKLPWHLIDFESKLSGDKERSIGIQTGRGCPFTCTYCSHTKEEIEKYRCFSPEFILDNLEPLIRKHNITQVYFYEPHFISIPSRVEEICKGILDRKLKIEWTGSARANTIVKFKPELLSLMKESGCNRIGFGFESGSKKILKRIDKRIEPWQIIEAVRLCDEYGIIPEACFMAGFPFETWGDILKTLVMIAKVKQVCPKSIIHIQGYVPFPGTILYDECCEKYDLKTFDKLEDWGDYGKIKGNTPWMNPFKKVFIKLLSGSVYASYYEYINNRSDMKHKKLLHILSILFYRIILVFSLVFKKEFSK